MVLPLARQDHTRGSEANHKSAFQSIAIRSDPGWKRCLAADCGQVKSSRNPAGHFYALTGQYRRDSPNMACSAGF